MTGRVAGTLTLEQIQQQLRQADAIANSSTYVIPKNEFIFFAGFDGTNNDRNNVPNGEQTTNVAQLIEQAESFNGGNIRSNYYRGPGTAGSLLGSSAIPTQVTQEAILTANRAYNDFQEQAAAWLQNNPGGSIATAVTAFSRGADAAAIFSQMVFERGLTDPATGAILIPPGDVKFAGGVLFDPVLTGVMGNMTFPPNTQNLTIIRASDELRNLFKAADYSNQPGATTFDFIGNHANIGGSYLNDNISALTLEAGTGFLQRLGITISDVPASRKYVPDSVVFVRDEGIDTYGNTIWSTYGTYGEYQGPRLTDKVASFPVASDDGSFRTFTDYAGRLVTYSKTQSTETGAKSVMTIKDYFNATTSVVINRDFNSDGNPDQLELTKTDSDGSKTHVIQDLDSARVIADELAYRTDATNNYTEVQHSVYGVVVNRSFIEGEVTQTELDKIRNNLPRDFRETGNQEGSSLYSNTLNTTGIVNLAAQLAEKYAEVQLAAYLDNVQFTADGSPAFFSPSVATTPAMEMLLQSELKSFISNGRVDVRLNDKNQIVIASVNREIIIDENGEVWRHYRTTQTGEVIEQADSNGQLITRVAFSTRQDGSAVALPVTTIEYFDKGQAYARIATTTQSNALRQTRLELVADKNSFTADYTDAQLDKITYATIDGVPLSDDAAILLASRLKGLSPEEVRAAYKEASAADEFTDLSSTDKNVAIVGGALQATKAELVGGTDFHGNPLYITQEKARLQSVSNSVGTLIDSLSLIKAIQNGQPLPIVASGLRLAAAVDYLDGTRDLPNLGAAASMAGAVLSMYGLADALKRNDAAAALSSASYAVYSVAEAANFLQVSGAISEVPAGLAAAGQSIGAALPYINLANSLAHGDGTGVAIAVVDIVMIQMVGAYAVPVIGWAYAVYSLLDSLFTDIPDPWGHARFVWDGSSLRIESSGETGGNEAVHATLDAVLASMNALIERVSQQNPGSQLGIIPNRMPGLAMDMDGYRYTDIDANTGIENHPALRFDTSGRPYNAEPGSPESYQSLIEAIIRSGLAREAIAPLWEVQTARMQTEAGDPRAGLREEERAGRDSQLALPLTGTLQTFRPVVLDLDGDGIETLARQDGVLFDIDNSGYQKQTGWLQGDDGFLVIDRSYNGVIDAGREMFSNSAVAVGLRGLAGMAWVDANYDGRIDARDPVWNELRVWHDTNVNAEQDAGETLQLAELGITELNYSMGTYSHDGQLAQLASPDMEADRDGLRVSVVPQGILVQGSSDGKLSLLVTRINDKTAVEANRDGVDSIEDVEAIISAPDLLANDTLGGFGERELTLTGLTNFRHGSGWIDDNNYVHFQPEANYAGEGAGFDYVAQAGNGQTGTGSVDVMLENVNDAPTLGTVEHVSRAIYGYTELEEYGGEGSPPASRPVYEPSLGAETPIAMEDSGQGRVVGADIDDAAGALTYELVNQPQYGAVSLDANGNFNYTSWKKPGVASDFIMVNGQYAADRDGTLYYGSRLPSPAVNPTSDVFQVRITDPHGASEVASITVPHYGPYLPPSPQGGGGKKPIAIDLDGNGFEFVNVDDSSIFFDVTGDGWKRRTAWVGKNDGLLAYDIDGDGKIDKPGEISFASYKDGAQSDLQGMAAFDSNHDGLFDAQDEKWARFGIWRDANQNGITDAGELRSLDDMGVQAIKLASDGKFQVINGQTVHGIGSISMVNGSELAMADVSLAFSAERQVPQADGTFVTRTPVSPFSPSGQQINGTEEKDLLLGNNGNDIIDALADDDQIFDDVGNDIIEAGSGDDSVYSGADNDFVNGADGNDLIYAGKGIDLVLGGAGDDVILAEDGNDIAFGGDGKDFIAGGNGSDVLSGDAGDDQLMGEAGNDALFGRDGNDRLLGMEGADLLDGSAGNDWLDGGAGVDRISGGIGNDTYVVDSLEDSTTELPDEGIDTVRTSLQAYQLAGDIENLVMLAPDQMLINMTAIGNALNNNIITGRGNDWLDGGAGNDLLDGGVGADLLIGGSGNDSYSVDNADDSIIENENEGNDTVKASISFTLTEQLENLMLTGSASINASGNQLDNILTGNRGNNRINGGLGADSMIGGSGDDSYFVDQAGDKVIELSDEGNDTVITGMDYQLDEHVENLVLTGSANLAGSGNALNNIISGNAANNTLSGGENDDTLIGNTGNDLLDGGSGNDIYLFNQGDGLDRIVDRILDSGGTDRVRFGTGLNFDNVTIRVVASDGAYTAQVRTLDGNGDEIAGQGIDFAVQADACGKLISPLEEFAFADGSVRTFDELLVSVKTTRVSANQNAINGDRNDDIIIANSHANTIVAGSGHDAIFAAVGKDTVYAGNGNDFIAGGKGEDTLHTGNGKNVIAFNRSEGRDTLVTSGAAQNTLSLGGGISLSDLSLKHVGKDLVIGLGRSDSMTLRDWYAGNTNRNLVNLQIIHETSVKHSTSLQVEQFDFRNLVAQFDSAAASQSLGSSWSVMKARLDSHLDTNADGHIAALGGDLSFDYAAHGSYNLTQSEAGNILRNPAFGLAAQSHLQHADVGAYRGS